MPEKFFTLDEAARRLRMTIRALREHLYAPTDEQYRLKPDGMQNGRLLFRASTLDNFRTIKRNRGRPPQKGSTHEDQPTCGPTHARTRR